MSNKTPKPDQQQPALPDPQVGGRFKREPDGALTKVVTTEQPSGRIKASQEALDKRMGADTKPAKE